MISILLFERPVVLAAICACGEFLLIWLWSRQRSPAMARAAWVGAATAAALVGISIGAVTQRERIAQICREMGKAVDDGDVGAISARIASDFSMEEWDRDELLRRLTQTLTRVRVDQVRLRRFDIAVADEKHAVATFDASCNVRTAEGFAGALPSRWRLTFRREGKGWVVTQIDSIPIQPLRIGRLEDWLR